MNPLKPIVARIRQTELDIAVRLDDRDLPRIAARHWSHNGPRAAWALLGAVPLLPIGYSHALPLTVLAVILTVVYAGSRLADRTHEIGWIDQVHPCPLCTGHTDDGDGHGNGGLWLDWDGDQPPSAPTPMDDYDDERVRAMAGDLDAQHALLIEQALRP